VTGPSPAGPSAASPDGYLIRAASPADLDAIIGFEIDIARVSFGAGAITDERLHHKRVSGALGQPGEVTLVAVTAGETATVVGWAWLSARKNSLTGERYGNFRSLAAADVPGRPLIGELLLAAVIEAANRAGLHQLTGKVHAANLGMRTLYRKFGFEAAHLTMELHLPDDPS
jgi:L-amino acid N-acyltransferase YncA